MACRAAASTPPAGGGSGSSSRIVSFRGLDVELDGPEGPSSHSVADADASKDSTGVGLLWEGATTLLCDYLEQNATWLVDQGTDRALELGAGAGIAGMVLARAASVKLKVTLTDYHPVVLDGLSTAVSRNGLARQCTIDALPWGDEVASARAGGGWPCVFGAELAISEASAAQLGATVAALLDGAPSGVFLYAHQERRAVFRAADGAVAREARDGALRRLEGRLRESGLGCRELASLEPPEGSPAAGEGPLRLLAFGGAAATAALPEARPAPTPAARASGGAEEDEPFVPEEEEESAERCLSGGTQGDGLMCAKIRRQRSGSLGAGSPAPFSGV